jgi:hypothetical protein
MLRCRCRDLYGIPSYACWWRQVHGPRVQGFGSRAFILSRTEAILEALKMPLETVSGAMVERSSVLPEKVPAGGLIILRDGDSSEPEQALGGAQCSR